MTYRETRFEWDEAKNVANQKKHGVSFEEARQVLEPGVSCLEFVDEAHSGVEERLISIVVVWTERDENVLRIISARRAMRRERARYFSYMEQGR